MVFPCNFGDFDFHDGGVGEGHGAVGNCLYAERNLVAVVEHDGIFCPSLSVTAKPKLTGTA